jgi:dihydroflavonol-4-reductase
MKKGERGLKALITGGDGLLGSHLTRQLLEQGFSVRVFLQSASASPTLRGLPVERVEGDLLDEGPALAEAVRGCRYVFHCAAITDLWADPKIVWKVNLDGTRKVIEACVREKVGRLIFTGSASSFQSGPLENPGDESGAFPGAYRGIAYMESKHSAMELVRESTKHGDLDAVIVAPTFMLGDLDFRPSSGELIRQFILRGLRYTSRGGRNFVCASDVAAAMISAIEKGRSGEAYIAGGQNLSYFDFFSKVARIANVPPPRRVLPDFALLSAGAICSGFQGVTGRRAPLDLRTARLSLLHTYYRPQKAIDELNMPQTSIETGIEQTLRGLKEFGHI